LLKELYDVQLMVLRRLLGVNNRSMIAPLFSELGLIPLPYRRVVMVLRYLQKQLNPKSQYVGLGIDTCRVMRAQSQRCWLTDL
ncbi:hypothetical protein BDZ89DRAFT_896170, partial [Hymenopellis radicata]